ncbi:MAG: heparan-alpha-glucosaminide N-acetyltransferase domain-containing protein [Promethearchaeota archaeon]
MSLLEDFIKDLNMLETARRNTKFARIRSIDFVKGLAICLIVMAHAGEQWVSNDFRFAWALLYAWMDVFGPSLFIFLSALSVVFSLKKKMGFIPEKKLRNSVFTRGFIIIGLGVVFNIGTRTDYPLPFNLWGWNILMFIGFSQIICYYVLKLSRGVRLVIGTIIIFITDPIRYFLYYNKDTDPIVNIFHFILISPSPHLTFIPYVSLCFFSTIFGEYFFEAMLLETRKAYMDTFGKFIRVGLFLILIGVVWGSDIVNASVLDPKEYFFMDLIPIMQNQPFIKIEGIPRFLVRGTPQNSLYALGMALLILGIFFYLIDIKQADNKAVNMFIFYGRVSLSIFFISYIGLFLYVRFLDVKTFFFVIIAYIAFLGMMLFIWNKYFEGKYSLEWLMSGGGGKKKKKKKPSTMSSL